VLQATTAERPAAPPQFFEMLADLLARASIAIETDRADAGDCIRRAAKLLPEGLRLPRDNKVASGGLAPWQELRLKRYVSNNLADRLTTPDLAQVVQLSVGHFTRAFKVTFGMPPRAYLTSERIREAKRLMAETRASLCEIALSCGLADQAHFCHTFRRVEGCSPAAWRRGNQAAS
jgi:AraC family transcriptional regulator